jgi:tRNA A-37 threonylcarbamoyl transferase component Bud32/tetratricopeptide (TPR) repeat protein
MSPERWARIKAIVEEVDSASASDRGPLLERLCAGDPDLRSDVEPYLAAETSGTFIQAIIGEQAASLNETAGRQQRFGHYRLVKRIGQGGMATVYEATRLDDFHKKAALKIIRQGLDSDFARTRFLQERQVLASLEHPNIARLLDGGESDDGSPWLVMEFIDGEPIDRYCEKLTPTARLRLFLKVCQAVGYAHRNMVIHRDLKPANILVTPEGEPKLLDFGIAKLLDPSVTKTQTEMTALTPHYASPEQVRGQPVSAASDVYSLGVILYQLLTGRTPYTFTSATAIEIDRLICVDPPAPPGLGDELDHIVLMALRKEPERRYASVERFADDIERYLEHRPVRARPDTVRYRTFKFVRRNWLGTIAVSVVALTLAAGFAVNLAEQRRTARRFAQVRQLANRFLFDFHDEIAKTPGTVKAREMIVSTALEYLNSLSDDAKGDPALQWELAMAYGKVAEAQGSTTGPSLRRPADGIRSYEKAIGIGLPLVGSKRLSASQNDALVDMLCEAESAFRAFRSTKRNDAIALGRELVARSEGVTPLTRSRALGELALTLGAFGDLTGSEEILRKIVSEWRENMARNPTSENRRRLGVALTSLGKAKLRLTDFEEGTSSIREGLDNLRTVAAEHPENPRLRRFVFMALSSLGDASGAGDEPSPGAFEEAANFYEEAISVMEPLIAADAKDLASRNDAGLIHNRAAYALADVNPRRALPHARRAAELLDRGSPQNTDTRAQPRIMAGNAYRTLGEFEAAEAQLKDAERILVAKDNDTRADLDLAWARLEAARGNRARSADWFGRALAIDEQLFQKSPTPANAWALARTLEFAAVAVPESAPARRQRVLAVWMEESKRYPNHAYLEQQVAEARSRLRN